MLRINIGCGQTPTQGWRNFDNSFSLRLSKFPLFAALLRKFHLLNMAQYQFIQFAGKNEIEYGNAVKGLPIADGSVDVLYSSHMLEHLDRNEADIFIKEVLRILRPGGIVRLAVPDIKKQVAQYVKSGNADSFIEGTHLSVPRPASVAQRLRSLLIGGRQHQWMYDGDSLSVLLQKHGFQKTKVLDAGETMISNHREIDLYERSSESVYVEAKKPLDVSDDEL